MCGLGDAFLCERDEGVSGAFDHCAAQGDIRGCVGRDGGEPAFAEPDVRNLHEGCLPQHKAVQAEAYVWISCSLALVSILLVHLVRKIIKKVLSHVRWAIWRN